jgi:hypothetical protein
VIAPAIELDVSCFSKGIEVEDPGKNVVDP